LVATVENLNTSLQPEMTDSNTAPRVFISYSWSSPDHVEWVINLATELRQSGVDVILDKWDLKEGDDANAFMERMVTDPSIDKVLLVCDRTYVAKADGRKGGVGSEAQIISAKLYDKIKQNKFVALLRQRDDDGKALVPVYYGSRIHIDYSDPTTTSEALTEPSHAASSSTLRSQSASKAGDLLGIRT